MNAALPDLVTAKELAAHCHRSISTIYQWSNGSMPSPYPEPVRHNGRLIGWRREDIEATDRTQRISRRQYLYPNGI
ncbi:helix-turn-helix transcriptional regulator [Bifidobacterium samirii]|uniref:Uncharacterized protein n=1 Tax=Bifidobacterium samirii TaxID=2306974 RepID=A0A430FJJ8_9BIFI|nr:hypothetical protein [Bifidobacterium samirii]RSX52997.1 hypothetical protein D2E24_1668 [Bifidobacterium samirii]